MVCLAEATVGGPIRLDFDSFDLLTFDCYGTLIDWEQGILAALRPLLAAHGAPLDDEAALALYARLETEAEAGPWRPYAEVLAAVVEGFGREVGFAPSREERDSLVASLPAWRPFPDTVAALRRLRARYRLAILSNIDDALFASTAPRLEVPFDWVVTAEQVRSYKPAPAHFQEILRRSALPPGRILHVAQSLFHDFPPARACGLATVWIDRRAGRAGAGATPPAAARPDLSLPDLASLADLVEGAEA